MTKSDSKVLNHLTPITDYADTYLCGIYYKNKDEYMETVYNKVVAWVKARGGTIRTLDNNVTLVGETKGYMVKIVFPSFNPAKVIMAELYNSKIRYSHNVLIRENYGIYHEHSRYIPAMV